MGRAKTRGNAGRRSRPETGNTKWFGQSDRAKRKQTFEIGKRERVRGNPVGGHYLTRLTLVAVGSHTLVNTPDGYTNKPHTNPTQTTRHGPDMDNAPHKSRASKRNVCALAQPSEARA